MLTLYQDGLAMLLEYREFQVLYAGLRYGLLLVVLFLLVIALLHIAFLLGFNSPLYRRRSPARGWDKKFAAALITLMVATISFYWLLGYAERLVS